VPKISIFLILAFGLSWAVAAYISNMGGFAEIGEVASVGGLMLFMMGPAIAAMGVSLMQKKRRLVDSLGFSGFKRHQILSWSLLGWAIPIVFTAAAIAISLWVGHQTWHDPIDVITAQLASNNVEAPMTPRQLFWIQVGIGLPVGLLFNTVFLLISEELGWRGWLQTQLAGLGFWKMNLVIGVIWGVWHAPIILMGHNYGDLGYVGVLAMIALTIALSPYLGLARERGGVIAAAALHGSVNAVGGVSVLLIPDASWPWNGLLGVGGLIVMLAGWPIVQLVRRRRSHTLAAQ
jgi:membrane protease YdiL (CAAX protease family)